MTAEEAKIYGIIDNVVYQRDLNKKWRNNCMSAMD